MKGVHALPAGVALVAAAARTQRIGSSTEHAELVDIAALKSIPLFAHVTENDLKQLADISSLRRFKPRSVFAEENEECHTLHVVLEGTIEIYSGSE